MSFTDLQELVGINKEDTIYNINIQLRNNELEKEWLNKIFNFILDNGYDAFCEDLDRSGINVLQHYPKRIKRFTV